MQHLQTPLKSASYEPFQRKLFFYSTISLLTFCTLVSNIPLSLSLSLFLAQYGFGFDHL
jgi:hypothetical protein